MKFLIAIQNLFEKWACFLFAEAFIFFFLKILFECASITEFYEKVIRVLGLLNLMVADKVFMFEVL
jgi:hypothetical protein